MERSFNLTKIARDRNFEVNVSDCLDIPAPFHRLVLSLPEGRR